MISINSIVAASHHFVRQYFRPGDAGIDATAGNGHDTLFLAELAGEQGLVHAFDIQPVALERTRALLESRGLLGRVRLHLADHKDMAKIVAPPVQAVMFNLGYLPGGNKDVKTASANTIAALAASLSFLAPGGIVSVVTYSGHPGGEEEERQVSAWVRQLNPRIYTAVRYSLENKPNNPPKLWLIQKSTGS